MEQIIQQVKEIFQYDPTLSINGASARLQLPSTTGHRILSMSLSLFTYKLQFVQAVNKGYRQKRFDLQIVVFHSRLDIQNTSQKMLFLMIEFFASTV